MSEPTTSSAGDVAGFAIGPDFERFSQRDDVFSRSWWDESIRSESSATFYATYRRPLDKWRKAKGFTQRDYALRNAAWHVADVFAEMYEDQDRRDGFLSTLSMLRDSAAERLDVGSPQTASQDLKRAASTLGATQVGITSFDERWVYTDRFSVTTGEAIPNDLPDGLGHVIVIAQAMDQGLIATAPSALSGAATGLGYSHDALVLLAIAQYIRNLGYQAIPSMNDTALAVPLALAAGIGEYGRHGLVISPELGPSFRIGKIFTDLPLAHDAPVHFGVKEFCEQCTRCSAACPAKAIPSGGPVSVSINRSGLKGVTKWSVDGEACFGYWTKINSDCAVCLRVCPYNRDLRSRRGRLWKWLASGRGRRIASWWHDRIQGGKRQRSGDWWAQKPE